VREKAKVQGTSIPIALVGPEFGATFASSQVDGIAREKCFHYA
jgi:hypothetical protein